MGSKKEILIVGAGPSGLSMAIFLAELGYMPRIIDKKTQVSDYSKALGVNPRTLQIFEPFKITDRFLENGRIMNAINLWKGDKLVYKNNFNLVKHNYPFMLIQPQKESEIILREEVERRGIKVEFDSELNSLQFENNRYNALINNQTNSNNYDFVIGADGAHSKVREQLNIQYNGYRYNDDWELYDVELTTNLNEDEGHLRLFNEGGMIMIRLKNNIWRVAGNMSSLLNYLPQNTSAGTIHWQSKFNIQHKVANNLLHDNAFLIGDAAHLHSPIGARGMNLGIEDAYILSNLIAQGKYNNYEKTRKPYLQKTVNTINNITMGFAGNSSFSKLFRNQFNHLTFMFPIVMPRIRKFVMGLN